MAESSYERQHLALFAAGYINAAGTTAITLGCVMTRISAGHYGLILDANSGLINDESFTLAQAKGNSGEMAVVDDFSNTEKRIRVFNPPSAPAVVDTDIEVQVYRSVTK